MFCFAVRQVWHVYGCFQLRKIGTWFVATLHFEESLLKTGANDHFADFPLQNSKEGDPQNSWVPLVRKLITLVSLQHPSF